MDSTQERNTQRLGYPKPMTYELIEGAAERFWSHVDCGSKWDCWLWKGTRKRSGATFNFKNTQWSSRRLAYVLHYRESLDSETKVIPTCRNDICLNPHHLYARPDIKQGDGFKHCACCHLLKPIGSFHKSRSAPDGHYAYCRECNVIKKREYEQRPGVRERDRKKRAVRKFGLTVAWYDETVEAQGNGCAICGGPGGKHGLAIDHSHAPDGTVRGLLCDRCNAGIGMFLDRPSLLMLAVAYLEKWSAITASGGGG